MCTIHSITKRHLSIAAIFMISLPFFCRSMHVNAADVTINIASTKQEIDGFGASSAWCGTIPSNVMNVLYGDLGFSILRLRIEEGIGDNWKSGPYTSWAPELANAKAATAKGALVFATPWNPPASLRLTGGGGKYSTDPTKWATYRDYLNTYVKYMKDNGVNLHAISVQNEPDYSKDWTYWTPTQAHDFVLNYGATINTKLISAESFNFSKNMYDQILNDSNALTNVSILGMHLYGTSVNNFAYPLFESKGRPAGKKLWMTEHYIGEKETDQGPANTVAIGKEIHDCMVTGNMSGYTYWWITWPNGLATGSGTIYQRAYAIGQFSKYIRPGYFRVEATPTPATDVYVSAYSGSGKVVIVAVNTGTGAVNQKFTVQGGTVAQFATYLTASGKNMVAGSPAQVSSGSFSASLPAQSITTFVGVTGTTVKTAPVLKITAPLSTGSFTAPATVPVDATASDADGSISHIDFYDGATLVHSEWTAPYSWDWANVTAGTHVLKAIATDNDGNTAQDSVTITIQGGPLSIPRIKGSGIVVHQVYDIQGNRLGAVVTDGNRSLDQVVGKLTGHSGIYVTHHATADGIATRKVEVP